MTLLYEMGEGAPEESLKPGGGLAGAVVALMGASLPAAHHRLVSLAVLECHVRYARVLQQHAHLIPAVAGAFIDRRGLAHPSDDVAPRACYLFSRLVKVWTMLLLVQLMCWNQPRADCAVCGCSGI